MRSKRFGKLVLAAVVIAGGLAIGVPSAPADSSTETFEGFDLRSPDGQGGWRMAAPLDVTVVANSGAPAAFGAQSLRISNGSFASGYANQLFSQPVANEAGEQEALSGTTPNGIRQHQFTAEWQFASTSPNEQPNLAVSVSPDRGDGSRLSVIRMKDAAGGMVVDVVDVPTATTTGGHVAYVVHPVASLLARDQAHTVRLEMDLNDGPSNDVLRLYVDGTLGFTGTSWENYYWYDSEAVASGKPPTVNELLFRIQSAFPTTTGHGFLVDNVSVSTPTPPVPTTTTTTTASTTTTTTTPPATTPPTTAAPTTTTAPPATSTTPVTAPPSTPTAPVSAPATPGQGGSIVVTPPTTVPAATGGGAPPSNPAPPTAEVSWDAGTFGANTVTVKVDPKPTLAIPPAPATAEGPTPTTTPLGPDPAPPAAAPATSVGNGLTIGAGNTVLEILATDQQGNPVTQLAHPARITIPAGGSGGVPAYSRDHGRTWTMIPELTEARLPAGQADGYFVEPDGAITIFTTHLTYFGLLSDAQAPTVKRFGAVLSGDSRTVRFIADATDNIEVTSYVLARDGLAIALTRSPGARISLPRADGNYVVAALDDAGNVRRSRPITIYGTTVVDDDVTPPSPFPLQGRVVGRSVRLGWKSAQDPTGVTYLVFKDGKPQATTVGLAVTLPRLAGRYTVDAIDRAGNRRVSNGVRVQRVRGIWRTT